MYEEFGADKAEWEKLKNIRKNKYRDNEWVGAINWVYYEELLIAEVINLAEGIAREPIVSE
jgi:hypothetical protein